MLPQYRTLQQEGSQEIIIKKSRFIGRAKPVSTEEEALAFIEAIKKEHWSANHNCYAYVIGDRNEIQRQSDDGEPSGTAGKPILEVIKNMDLRYVVVVVTRYFGGVKLGASGLIRAYTDGAVAGIEAAEPVYQVLHRNIRVTVDYTWQGKLENELRNAGVLLDPTEFTDRVTFNCWPVDGEADSFAAWITDVTQGQSQIEIGESKYIESKEAKI